MSLRRPAAPRLLALEFNALALMTSTASVAALGLVFWVVAAHAFTAEEVGRASAEVAAMTLLAALSQLNLINVLPRFLPLAGVFTGRLIGIGYAAASSLALLTSSIYVFTPLARHTLVDLPGTRLVFVVCTLLLTVFTIQDAALVGLRAARWVPVENLLSSMAKITLLIALGVAGLHSSGIFVGWISPTVFAIIAVNAYLVLHLVPRARQAASGRHHLPSRRSLMFAAGAEYGTGVSQMIVPQVLPLLVVARLGSEANGYFYQPLLLNSAISLLVANIATSLVVEAANNSREARRLFRRAVVLALVVAIPAAMVEVVGAHPLLGLLGHDYVVHGAVVTETLGLAVPLNIVNILFACACRIERQFLRLFVVQASLAAAIITSSSLLIGPYGLRGVAVGYAVSQAVFGLALIRPLVRLSRRLGERDACLAEARTEIPMAAHPLDVCAVLSGAGLYPPPRPALATAVFSTGSTVLSGVAGPTPAPVDGPEQSAEPKRGPDHLPEGGTPPEEEVPTRSPAPLVRQLWGHLAAASLILAVVVPLLEATGTHSPIRIELAVLFVLFLPGLPIALLIGARSLALTVTTVTATSIAINVLVPLVMLQTGFWHPLVAEIVTGAIAVAVLMCSYVMHRRAAPPAPAPAAAPESATPIVTLPSSQALVRTGQ